MKISIQSPTKHRPFTIYLPLSIALNRLTLLFFRNKLKKYNLTIHQLLMIKKEIKKFRKHHPTFEFVSVDKKDGEKIRIYL